MAGSTYAVVIAVENYQQPDINEVAYAIADADAFAEALRTRLRVPEDNIKLWIDHDATKIRIENELPYEIRQLGKDDTFIFFYAGHGFHARGFNRLTTWDTYPSNPEGTTACIEEVLLAPLRERDCRRSLVFIDACAVPFSERAGFTRDMISGLSKAEFEAYIASSDYAAAFFSCSPSEKSWSLDSLKHGIWTHHLLAALNGEAKEAVHRDGWVTGDSLNAYLKVSVPKFIREKTTIKHRQRPYAMIASNGGFPIVRAPEAKAAPSKLPRIKPKFDQAFFRSRETRPFRNIDGFDRKRHTVPDRLSDNAAGWAGRLLHPEMVAELERVHERAKSVFKLKKRDIAIDIEESDGGSVDCEFFRFAIFAGQNPEEPSEAVIERNVVLRVPESELPEEFDTIFEAGLDEFVVPFTAPVGAYDKLVMALEDLEDGEVKEHPSAKSCQYRVDGTVFIFRMREEELVIKVAGECECLPLIDAIRKGAAGRLVGTMPPLLGGPNA